MANNAAINRAMGRIKSRNAEALETAPAEDLNEGETIEGAREGFAANVEGEPAVEQTPSEESKPEAPPTEAPLPSVPEPTPEPEEAKPAEPEKVEVDRSGEIRRQREIREARAELARERAEKERLQVQYAEMQRQWQMAQQPQQPIDPEPQIPPDPGQMPDREQDPLGYDRWRVDSAFREAALARREAWQNRQYQAQMTAQWQQNNQQQMAVNQFDGLVSQREKTFAEENPHYAEAEKWLTERLGERMRRFGGVPAHLVPMAIAEEKRAFLIRNLQEARSMGVTNVGDYALQRLYDYAEVEGFRPSAQGPAVGTASVNGAARPSPSPQQRIADNQRRATAARSVTTMSPSAVPPADNEKMTADKYLTATPAERLDWQKKHPGFRMDDLMQEETNPLLDSMRAFGLGQRGR